MSLEGQRRAHAELGSRWTAPGRNAGSVWRGFGAEITLGFGGVGVGSEWAWRAELDCEDREGVGLPSVGGSAWKNRNVQVQKTCPGPGKGRSGRGRALDGEEGAGLIQSH